MDHLFHNCVTLKTVPETGRQTSAKTPSWLAIMDSRSEEEKYFIVMKAKPKPGSFSKGSIGRIESESQDEVQGPVFDTKGTQKLKKENVRLLSALEAQLLLRVSAPGKRLQLLQRAELFRAICGLAEGDVVVVQQKKEQRTGVVKAVVELVKHEASGELRMRVFEDPEKKQPCKKEVSPILCSAGDIVDVVIDSPRNALLCLKNQLEASNVKDYSGSDSGLKLQVRGVQAGRSPPITSDPGPALTPHPSLEVGSMVEIPAGNGAMVYGVVRWIGTPEGKNQPWAGVELDYEMKGCSDGRFGAQRYFTCNGNKAMFVILKNCFPDSRFLPLPPYKETLPRYEPHLAGGKEADEDIPPLRESEVLSLLEGRMRGIQGHFNSCYLDASLFSVFTSSMALDSVLHCPAGTEGHIQNILRKDIVNQLRRQGFVPAENVMNFRKLLGCSSFLCEEKDPEEFISTLLHQVLSVDPLLKIRSNGKTQDSYTFQIILEKEQVASTPTVQQLLETSFLACDLKFQEIPSCLIIQMPRFGKKYKMFPQIIPSTELDITDLIHNNPRECFLCGKLAELECYDCLRDPKLMPGRIKQFCNLCEKQVHAHRLRQDHRPRGICYPACLREGDPVPRLKLELFAVLCIETSHYVSFVKYGSGRDSWLFFDSMADRCGGENGYNIPEIRACPQVGDFLSQPEEDWAKLDLCYLDEFVKRLLCDSYMCFYQCPALSLYR
nr:PREDICTED: ubiquitin carboxyl-terminal hydrolase CYLD-like isoform X3 [Lepisosteus oculatus]